MQLSNEHSEFILKKYLEQSVSDSQKISFFLLTGSQSALKSDLVCKLAKEILWWYFLQDFLHIKDFSEQLWKQHILKIEYDGTNEVSKQLSSSYSYTDLWVRDINSWLSLSALWTSKIVLIENIERMNWQSMNAFLKTCEEPLPNRIIIATTWNKASLLDTIISRAITIPFFDCSYDELVQYCDDKWYFVWDDNLKSLMCFMSMWKQDQLDKFHKILSEQDEIKSQFQNILTILWWDNIGEKYRTLINISNNWLIEPFVDGIIHYYISHDQFQLAQNRLEIKKRMNSNVKIDHLLFYGLI